jgi:hypothetical protein
MWWLPAAHRSYFPHSQSGGKRDDFFASLRMGKRPACSFVRPHTLGPQWLRMVFSKLSKLLNQENALSAPWVLR